MGEVSLPDVVILLSLCLVNFYVVLGFNRLKKQRNVSEVGLTYISDIKMITFLVISFFRL